MKAKITFIILFLLCFKNNSLLAQNISGTWEGLMADEFVRINIIQNNEDLCGNTYDIVLNNKKSHCRAYFSGNYNKKTQIWTMRGISFIENSGDHVLMTLNLWKVENTDKKVLRGMVSTGSSLASFFGADNGDLFWLHKVSNSPGKLPGKIPTCYTSFKEAPEKKVPAKTKILLPKKTDSTKHIVINKVAKIDSVIRETDLIKKLTDATTPLIKNDVNENIMIAAMKARKKNEVSTLSVNVRKIELKLYDNGIVDNDTVSVFYNGRLIKSKQGLTENPILINIELEEDTNTHEITMFAENLGTFAPNTALIVVTAGKKRFELHSSANLNENAVLFVEYKP